MQRAPNSKSADGDIDEGLKAISMVQLESKMFCHHCSCVNRKRCERLNRFEELTVSMREGMIVVTV